MFNDPTKENPPKPADLYKCVDGHIYGLRSNAKIYKDFLKTYGKAVYGRDFKVESKSKTLSTFFPVCLETFLILAYDNGYAVWKKTASTTNKMGTDTTSSDAATSDDEQEHASAKFKFTSSVRGAKRSEGCWNQDSCVLHDKLFDKIEEQRKDPELGEKFETNLLIHEEDVSRTSRSKSKRPLRNSWPQPPPMPCFY